MDIVNTPKPPYFAVIAPAMLASEVRGYPETAQRLFPLVQQLDGFLGLESCYRGNFIMAVSYWRTLEAIAQWRAHPQHIEAKQRAAAGWFTHYVTRIARVERQY
jgi:heme-degrading monooxygenase HmoA